MYSLHHAAVEAKELPGRKHKMVIGPNSALKAKQICGGLADFPPLSHAPAHTHSMEEEVIYIHSGFGQVFFNGVPENVEAGAFVSIPPGVEHSIKNNSQDAMRVIYFFTPPVVQGSYDKK